MSTSELIPGRKYLYTAVIDYKLVVYNGLTAKGYAFSDGVTENELSALTVENYVEELKFNK